MEELAKTMSGPWFFLSYARTDSLGNKHLKKFYKDLVREVRRKAGMPSEKEESEIGFFDTTGIETGTQWAEKIAVALSNCRVLVCLYSPGYFNSPFCGKEFAVFRSRVDHYLQQAKTHIERPPLILPVLWDCPARLPKPLPHAIAGIQYQDDELGQIYAREGLYFLMKVGKPEHKSEYAEFLLRFADKLVREAKSDRLLVVPALDSFDSIKNAFCTPTSAESSPVIPRAERVGPKVAQFIYVAARSSELVENRQRVDCYGEEGGPEWQPYYPDIEHPVGIISQGVATTEGLLYETFRVDQELMDKLRLAEDKNTIVVLVVDPWSIRVEAYQKHMLDFDKKDFLNCGVLIPWNESDDETRENLPALQSCVQKTFKRKFILNTYFRNSIRSVDELQTEISNTINEVRRRLLLMAQVEQPIESGTNPIPSISGLSDR